jgi:hypothetical protein
MNNPAKMHFMLAALAVVLCSTVVAGPVWEESVEGDAGSRPNDKQVTQGSGELGAIEGALEGNTTAASRIAGSVPDFEDMFSIRICDPISFLASTVNTDGGFANFNTQLWLFKPSGIDPLLAFGAVGSKDTAVPPSLQSRLLSDPTDGSPSLADPGIYYIAISGVNIDPDSLGGPIFNFMTPVEISGPDGNGGNLPFDDWVPSGPPEIGDYVIRLHGVTFASEGTLDCNDNGIHDMCDIAFGPATDANSNMIPDKCEADLDDNGSIGVGDMLALLAAWGPCAPPCPADFNGDGVVNVADLLFLLALWS